MRQKNSKLSRTTAFMLAFMMFFTTFLSNVEMNVQAAVFEMPVNDMVLINNRRLLRFSTKSSIDSVYFDNQRLKIENAAGKGLLISIDGSNDTANFAPAQVTWTNPNTEQKYQAYCINAAYSGYGDVADYDVTIMQFSDDLRFSGGGSNGNGHLAGDTARNSSVSYKQALLGAVNRGYPTRTAAEVLGGTAASFGVSQDALDYAAYVATKFAIWSIVHDSYTIDKWKEATGGSYPQSLKNAVLTAQKDIYDYAMSFQGIPVPRATLTAGEPTENWDNGTYEVIYTISAENAMPDTDIFVRMDVNASPFPADMLVTDMNGNPYPQGNNPSLHQYILPAGTTEFKVSVPIPDEEEYSQNYSLMVYVQVPVKTLVFAKANKDDVQDYILAGNGYSNPTAEFTIDSESENTNPPNPKEGKLKVIKLDARDNATPLAGATFDLYNSKGQLVDTGTTDKSGVWIPNIKEADVYTVVERSTNNKYQLTEPTTLVVTVFDDRETTATFRNFPKQDVTVYKEDAITGEPIPGVQYEIYQIDSKGAWRAVKQTDNQGRIVFEDVPDGTYLVREVSTVSDYILDPTPQYVTVRNGQAPSLKFLNSKHPSLSISKLDKQTGASITDPATFLVEQVDGSYSEHVTTVNGTVTLKDLPVGSYKIYEESAPNGYVVDGCPQTVYIGEGESKTVYLHNLKKPVLTIEKIDAQTGKPIPGTKFEIKKTDGTIIGTVTTGADGKVTVGLKGGELGFLDPSTYTVTEVYVPEPYVLSNEHQDITLNAGDTKSLYFGNLEMPRIIVEKYDEETGEKLPNTQFAIYEQADLSRPVIEGLTDENGQLNSGYIKEGTYYIKELNPSFGYMISDKTQSERVIVAKAGDGDIVVKWDNIKLPQITIKKVDSVTKEPIAGVTYRIEQTDDISVQLATATTDENGLIVIPNLKDTTFTITEISTLHNYILNPVPQHVKLTGGDRKTVLFENDRKPTLIVTKINALTQRGIPNTVYKIEYEQSDGSIKNLGTFKTDQNGQIIIKNANVGWHVITETIPAQGMQLPSNPVTRKYLSAGENAYLSENGSGNDDTGETPQGTDIKVTSGYDYMNEHGEFITNFPLNSLVIKKNDAITSEMLEGAVFEVRKLDGEVSGTSGTIIGRYTSDSSGIIVITGLEAGGYICEEVKSPTNYLISENSKQTTWLKADATSAVEITFSNFPYGHILVTKVDGLTNQPLSNARFKVTGGDGSVIGNTAGEYVTDENGQFLVENIKPQTVVITELEAPDNYAIDTTPQTVNVGTDGKTYKVSFKNNPYGTLVVKKYNTYDNTPLAAAEFFITNSKGDAIGNNNGVYVTDQQGTITVPNLDKQSIIVKETKAPDGFTLEQQAQTIDIEYGQTHVLNFYNSPKSSLIVKKVDEKGKPLAGAVFKVERQNGAIIGEFTSDIDGTFIIPELSPQWVVIREQKSPEGYLLDESPKTVEIKEATPTTVTFVNKKIAGLQIKKIDEDSKMPLSGVVFAIEKLSGERVGDEYVTDENGFISVLLEPNHYVVREIKQKDGYILDNTPRTVEVKAVEPTIITVTNKKLGGLQIKKINSVTHEPIANVEFTIKKFSGELIGVYKTGTDGLLFVPDLNGIYTYQETKAADGFIVDSEPRTVEVKSGEMKTEIVENTPVASLLIIKTDMQTKKPLQGVKFEVTRDNGEKIGIFETDRNGHIYVNNLKSGDYKVFESEALTGYELDTKVYDVTVKDGQQTKLAVQNKKLAGLRIKKIDSITKQGIYNVEFCVFDKDGKIVGNFYTDNNGIIDFSAILTEGRYTLRETRPAANYYADDIPRTVEFIAGKYTEIEWQNTPKAGQIQILKLSADDNEQNGLPAGTPLQGAIFDVFEYKSGNLVDRFITGYDGKGVSKPLPLGRYILKESQSPAYYRINNKELDVTIEFATQIVKLEFTNESANTGVSIDKVAPKEVMPNQEIRYDIRTVRNDSTVQLNDFYIRDVLPVDAIRLEKIVTGTYSQSLKYKITAVTNKGSTIVVADNLKTTQNNVIDCSNASLGLANDEFIISFTFYFGTVKAGFSNVEEARIYARTLNKSFPSGYRFSNKIDIGGQHQGEWVIGNSTAVSVIYMPQQTVLPKTGN